MNIHGKLSNEKVVKMHSSGMDGKLKKHGDKILTGLIYFVMEYVPEGTMYDIVNHFNGVGEIVAHFFMK